VFPKSGPRIFSPCPIRTCRTFCTGLPPPVCCRCTSGKRELDNRQRSDRRRTAAPCDRKTVSVLTYISSLSYRIFKFHNNDASFKSLKIARNEYYCIVYTDRCTYIRHAYVSCIMSSIPFWPRSCRRFTPLALVTENI